MAGSEAHNSGGSESRLTPAAVRRLRVAAACGLVALIVAGGAIALWLSRGGDDSQRTSAGGPPPPPPPVRLDALPEARSAERRRRADAPSAAGPSESRERREGRRRSRERRNRPRPRGPSGADMRREIAALAAEDGRLRALLSDYGGPELGTGETVWPVEGRVLLRFGWLWGARHAGIDIRVPAGTPVHAADWGRVVLSGRLGGYGKLICVQHTQTLSTCYAHNSQLRAQEGESVDSGEVIARSGCTGRCYGDHLHFEVREDGRAVNPRDYLGEQLSAID